jgi:rare lipoprotein A
MTGRRGPALRAWALTGLLGMLCACSSVPRFTRPDVAPPVRPQRMEAPAGRAQVQESRRASRHEQAARAESRPRFEAGQTWTTRVSWYGDGFHGRATASGEIFDLSSVSAAHRELPFGTWLQVVNKDNGKTLEVKVNDRGPFKQGRDLDLSREAARRLGYLEDGTARVEVRILSLP